MASKFSSDHVFECRGKRYRYRYRAVTSLGSGVHSKDYVSLSACRRLVQRLSAQWPAMEVERVRELLNQDNSVRAKQYELERNGRWVSESSVLATDDQP